MQKFENSLKNAIRLSKESIKRDGIGKYYLILMMNFIFNISIFLSPYTVSKWEMANEIKKGNKISVTGLYDSASGKSYFSQLQANGLKIIMFLAITLCIAILGSILYAVGLSIDYFADVMNVGFNLMIPAYIILVIFVLIIPFIQVPNSYISNKYPSLSPSSILKFSFYAFKNGGKLRMFLIILFEYGIKLLILFPFVVPAIILNFALDSNTGIGFMILLLALGFALFIILYPFITLPAILLKKELYDEIVFVKNSNKFDSTFNFQIEEKDSEATLNNMFGIENKKEEIPSSIKDKHDELVKIDKKKKKKEKLKQEFDEVINEENNNSNEETSNNEVEETKALEVINETKEEPVVEEVKETEETIVEEETLDSNELNSNSNLEKESDLDITNEETESKEETETNNDSIEDNKEDSLEENELKEETESKEESEGKDLESNEEESKDDFDSYIDGIKEKDEKDSLKESDEKEDLE